MTTLRNVDICSENLILPYQCTRKELRSSKSLLQILTTNSICIDEYIFSVKLPIVDEYIFTVKLPKVEVYLRKESLQVPCKFTTTRVFVKLNPGSSSITVPSLCHFFLMTLGEFFLVPRIHLTTRIT